MEQRLYSRLILSTPPPKNINVGHLFGRPIDLTNYVTVTVTATCLYLSRDWVANFLSSASTAGSSTFLPREREVCSAMTLAADGMSRLMSHSTSSSFLSTSGSALCSVDCDVSEDAAGALLAAGLRVWLLSAPFGVVDAAESAAGGSVAEQKARSVSAQSTGTYNINNTCN